MNDTLNEVLTQIDEATLGMVVTATTAFFIPSDAHREGGLVAVDAADEDGYYRSGELNALIGDYGWASLPVVVQADLGSVKLSSRWVVLEGDDCEECIDPEINQFASALVGFTIQGHALLVQRSVLAI